MKSPMTKIETRPVKGDQAQIPYRYVPVNQFTPLSNTNWLFVDSTAATWSVAEDNPWKCSASARAMRRDTGAGEETIQVNVELVSFDQNIFRVFFDNQGSPDPKVHGPVTQNDLDAIRQKEIDGGAPEKPFQIEGATLTFSTADLQVSFEGEFACTVKDHEGNVICQDANDSNGNNLGGTFVDATYGQASAFAKVITPGTDHQYGVGEVNVNVDGKDGYYVVGKSGLSMTNFNYDQITYVHPELLPQGYGLDESLPNYYFPMYFSAPWCINVSNQGTPSQHAYGIYLDNVAQTYVNTGDTQFGEGVGNENTLYFGSQSGLVDYYFIYGKPRNYTGQANGYRQGPMEVVLGLAYLCQNSAAPGFARFAAMPPKYIFGYFQGIYGAIGVNENAYPSDDPTIDNAIFFDDVLKGYQDAAMPLEGFAVDIDVQDTYKVFTINSRFFIDGDREGKSIFQWAHDQGLVTQTNITCFIKDSENDYDVLASLVSSGLYTNNKGADGTEFKNDGFGPQDAYCGQLQYGENEKVTAIFPDWGKSGAGAWWGPNYEALIGKGLDFVWQDMTTPSMDSHVIGNDVTDDQFDPTEIAKANTGNEADADAAAYAETFNWRSYHPQLLVTDPRFGADAKRSFAEVRNQHAYLLCEATYENAVSKSEFSKFQRSYIIARGGQIGSQHFGGLWMGDNQSDWIHLNLMVPMIVSMNMSGMSVVGADIGGFAQFGDTNTHVDPELLCRWVHAGCLLPWFRNHYDRYISLDPSTSDDPKQWKPKGHGKAFQELYNDAFGDYRSSMKMALELRYRWQEVFYTASYRYASSGEPMVKAMCMWYDDPGIDYGKYPELNSQFLLGGNDGLQIMAAPVLTKSQTGRKIYFPANANWFPYYLGGDTGNLDKYQPGGASVQVNVPTDEFAVYVREGAIIPTRYTLDGSVKSVNSYTTSDPLVMDIFGAVDGTAQGLCYLDDGGLTRDAETQDKYAGIAVGLEEIDDASASYAVGYVGPGYEWAGDIFLRLRAVGNVNAVSANSMSIPISDASSRGDFFNRNIGEAYYWKDSETGSVWIRLPASAFEHEATRVLISCGDKINVAQPI